MTRTLLLGSCNVLVEIARQRDDLPVRVLSSFDVPVLAELQGRNGIGKSLTIKLLQLLTGDQPWEGEDEAWLTLRDRLGPTSVTVSGLDDASTIEWDLLPSVWPGRPPDDVAVLCAPSEGGTGVELRVDGSAASLDEVRSILRVHRLVGDETLEDSVRARIEHMAIRARQEATAARTASSRVRTILAEVVEALEPLSGRVMRNLDQRIAGLKEQHKTVTEESEKARKRAARLLSLETRAGALARLEQLQADDATGKLSTELQAVNTELEQRRLERDHRFNAAVADVQLRERIQEARAEVERVEALLRRALDDARKQASQAELSEDTKPHDAEAVTAAHDALVIEIKQLREAQVALNAVPLVRQAASSLKRTLARVEPQSVLDHPFAVLRGEPVSGREIADGVEVELTRLMHAAPDPSGEQLQGQIVAASGRLEAIVELQRALARERRHTSALANRRAALLELNEQAEGDAGGAYVELEGRINELEDRRRELQGDHFRYEILLEALGPGEDLDRAKQRLARDVLAAGVVVSADLGMTRAAVEATLRELDYERRKTEAALEEAQRDLASATERRHLGGETLQHAALIGALRDYGVELPGDEVTETGAEELLRAVERVVEALIRLDVEAEAVSGAFPRIGERLDGDADVSRIDRVRGVAEQEIVEVLNQPILRHELFSDGTVEAYDHRRGIVTFRPPGASAAVTRALCAFSSGERVFAYTQMRLRAIAETQEPCANRIVVLDEFGAFLETRRIRALERLVENELLGNGIDRVLFVLPLTTNVTVNEEGFALLDRSVA